MPVTATRPVVERIAVELYERLRLLTAGWSPYTAVIEVIRPTRLGGEWTPKHLQIVLKNGESVRVPELDCTGNPPAIARQQLFQVNCHFMPSEKDPTPIDEYVETMHGDVIRVVCEPDLWYTFGGLSIDAEFGDPSFASGDGGVAEMSIPILVTYRVSEDDPWEVRA